MGEAKRRKQLDQNYGKEFGQKINTEKLTIRLGNDFIKSSEVPNVIQSPQFKDAKIKDSGVCITYCIEGFKIGGVAFPSVGTTGIIGVGLVSYLLDNNLSDTEANKLKSVIRSVESQIRATVANAYKVKFFD